MFRYVCPENVGMSSKNIKGYIELLEKSRLSTHNIIIAKGNDILYENYWAPFHKDFLHRMYSVTKSYVSLAIGFLEQDKMISLDDKMIKYFPVELQNQKDENLCNQSIRDMLMMATAKPQENWFREKPADRVQFYFANKKTDSRPSGTIFQYDSGGSFVLGALVERLTGMKLLEYLREKCLDDIGFSKEATCLEVPGGHSWGDSGLLCTAQDLLKTARFVMNHGIWNGKQLLNEEYIKMATGKQIDNNITGVDSFDSQGYGYQFWITRQNSYFFNGMGCQLAVCVPDKDLILIYNGDNQGNPLAKSIIVDNFFEMIVNNMENTPLPIDDTAVRVLKNYSNTLSLMTANGEEYSNFQNKINGVYFTVKPNPMGITKFRLSFEGKSGKFEYTNEQGKKIIYFGLCENQINLFPQEGYSDEVATVATKNIYYKCATSAARIEPQKLFIKVQIIDKYFGNLGITIGFRDNLAGIYMEKCAENFLNEYVGFASAIANNRESVEQV